MEYAKLLAIVQAMHAHGLVSEGDSVDGPWQPITETAKEMPVIRKRFVQAGELIIDFGPPFPWEQRCPS